MAADEGAGGGGPEPRGLVTPLALVAPPPTFWGSGGHVCGLLLASIASS